MMLRLDRIFLAVILLAAPLLAQRGDKRGEEQKPLPGTIKVPPAPVRTPAEEAATFKLAPGFHAELIAADPLIGDPIAMQFGPDGRLWVLEMRGYMPTADAIGEREPVCSVAVLTDTDKDGRYDKRVEFADKLVMPRAISLVGDGLLIAEPPHLWFFRDTNGDGVADDKTEIANDYGNITNPEHNANGLMWALDNWIYSANYTSRFRWLGEGKFARDATVTRGQWGITQDDAGRIYYNSNSDPLRYDAMPSAYLKRNAAFNAAGANFQLVPATLRIWPNRVTTGVNRGYKTLDAQGKITSMTAAAGPVVYRGALFPADFRGDAFVPEPSANLIKRIKLTEKDGKVSGANAYEGTEFMTATDERFRPVNLYNGPDGALYVVDLYRGIIQHRIYMTSFLRAQVEERGLDKGIGLGRIWRIVPDGTPKANFDRGLGRATIAELVEKLSDANGWVRDTAQRLLVEKHDTNAAATLRTVALDSAKPAAARLHALWTLEGLGGDALDVATVSRALDDKDPRVAAAAVRLSENFLRAPVLSGPGAAAVKIPESGSNDRGTAELMSRVIALVKTRAEPTVRLQLALSLGEFKTDAADMALRDLVIAAGRQPFLADAVVSGIAGRENALVESLVKTPAAAARSGEVLRYAVSAILKSGDAARIERVLAIIGSDVTSDWAQIPMLAGVRHFLPKSPDGRAFPGNLPAEPKPLIALAAKSGSPAAPIAKQLLAQLKWPGKAGAAEVAARPLTKEEQTLFDKGKTQFAALCAACHQPNGQGLAGLAPSLVYSRWILGDPRILARIVLNGKVQENLVMPPWKAALDDESVAAVLTFVRRSWGHDSDPVSPAIVSEARAATKARQEPFSDADLEELAQALGPEKK
jgi:glucose/arabinose dehydrogenase/mono/diheme cytochrome c family protein